MVDKRILRIGAIVAVAGATGFVMQAQAPSAKPSPAPVQTAQAAAALPLAAPALPEAAISDVQTVSALPEDAPVQLAALGANDAVTIAPSPTILASPSAPQACDADIALIAQSGAMIDLGLLSPCRPNQRVVIQHAGLAITGLTSEAGTLIATIPALQSPATVSFTFLDGTSARDSIEVADLDQFERFAIQWHEADAFQLRAYPEGFEAPTAEEDVISSTNAGSPSAQGNFLTRLGDSDAPRPLLAEVYTWPASQSAQTSPVALAIEAEVTSAACGREILGETLHFQGGQTQVRELSVQMPDCDAIGEFVALPNPAMTQTVAAN